MLSANKRAISSQFCRPIVPFLFISNSIAISIIQAILVIRVWHLFSNNRKIQIMIITMFGTSVVLAMGFTIDSAVRIRFQSTGVVLDKLRILGCRADRPHKFWRIYLPSLCLHTVLYALTAVQALRALRNRRTFKHAPILKRLLRDGGFFYFVVFVSVGVSTVGSFMKDCAQVMNAHYARTHIDVVQLNVVVAYSNYLVAINSTAVARVMLSIHSLAACLGSDTAWLLNNVELSRVGWRQGRTEGELIVERWCDDVEEIELRRRSTIELLQTSTVGVYNGAWLD
ncbi:hypothetical protein CPB85DRAFT_1366321 [Mucidula mucida]|nr:hypothetical protein CPB85DRAFT_1366321 [Mucidula mucida]